MIKSLTKSVMTLMMAAFALIFALTGCTGQGTSNPTIYYNTEDSYFEIHADGEKAEIVDNLANLLQNYSTSSVEEINYNKKEGNSFLKVQLSKENNDVYVGKDIFSKGIVDVIVPLREDQSEDSIKSMMKTKYAIKSNDASVFQRDTSNINQLVLCIPE